ncbi:MAG: hypothetical protein ACOYZ6_14195, partial [Chloroflexota bacterium]
LQSLPRLRWSVAWAIRPSKLCNISLDFFITMEYKSQMMDVTISSGHFGGLFRPKGGKKP